MMSPAISYADLTEDLHPDPYNAVFWNLFYQGLATMLPWNVLLFANRYFEIRLSEVPAAENFIYYFTVIFMVMKFIFFASGMSVSTGLNPRMQIRGSIGANAAVFAMIGALCGLEQASGSTLYYSLLVLIMLAAFCGSFLEAGFLRVLTFFPQKYTQAYLMGTGFAGVFGSFLHIFTSIGVSSAVSRSFAFVYFGISTLVTLVSLLLFHFMGNEPAYIYYYKKGTSISSAREESVKIAESSDQSGVTHSTTRKVFSQISDLFFTIILLTFFNMIISPLLIVSTRSVMENCTDIKKDRDLFHGVAFAISSIFDVIGKAIPALPFFAPRKIPFLALAAARILLIPIFLAGNVHLHDKKLPFSLYANDIAFMILIGIKALSGSFLGTLCMMWAPQRVAPIDRSLAMKLLVYAVGSGLLMGSVAGLLVKNLILQAVSYYSNNK